MVNSADFTIIGAKLVFGLDSDSSRLFLGATFMIQVDMVFDVIMDASRHFRARMDITVGIIDGSIQKN